MKSKTKPASKIAAVTERFSAGESLTTLFRESTSWFVGKKGKFRRAIIAQLGGKEKYREVSESHAGSRQLFGGKRRRRGEPAIKIDDSGVKRIRKIRWTRSAETEKQLERQLADLRHRIKHDEKLEPVHRASFRDTIRSIKRDLAVVRDGAWWIDRLYEPVVVTIKHEGEKGDMLWRKLKAVVYVSPKGRRYVECRPNEKASLILEFPKNDFKKELRLRRFEDSGLARRMSEEQEMIERGRKSLRETRKRKREQRLLRKKKKPSRRSA